MRVLVADDDPFSATVMQTVLRSAGHECVLARDGREAWEILQSKDAPRVVLLDWMMPEIDGIELCRRIRERATAEYVYVAILSVRSKQRDITVGFQAGADDFITKPYQVEEVLARLRVAERLVRSTSGSGIVKAVAEARASEGGDVIVRTYHRVGRIIFSAGKIAWAHVSDEPGSLAAILSSEPSISRDDVRAVIEECSVTGQNFADVLVGWELITRERLREVLRGWIRGKVATIASFQLPEVIFSPEHRKGTSGVLFEPEEVLPPELLGPATGSPAAASDAPPAELAAQPRVEADVAERIGRSLEKALLIDGACSAAIFDLRSGECLGSRGDPLDLDLVWSEMRLAAQGDLRDDLEDIMISTRRRIYLFRWYTRAPRRSIFLALDRTTATLGMARRALAECTGE